MRNDKTEVQYTMTPEELKLHLDELVPDPRCELNYRTPYELLVAVILSAQCTDKRVNEVTKTLFAVCNTPQEMEMMTQETLEGYIRTCGFYHNKAKNILSMSHDIVTRFGGKVPSNLEDLQTLAGVGRKTANVVYSEVFGGDAIAVDTHVLRISNRLGLVKTDDPYKCELRLMELFPQKDWKILHQQMVLFGRYKCKAMHPECLDCPFYGICVADKKMAPKDLEKAREKQEKTVILKK